MAKFTVDTHLFRELGELLVGRDSTALIELIKNAYDADATEVTVHGENLDDLEQGRIVVTDNGNGMSQDQFINGFLRIASRIKDQDSRRSSVFGRRYTGVKGIGRLAAHKLARRIEVESIHAKLPQGSGVTQLNAVLEWDEIEKFETIDEIPEEIISLRERNTSRNVASGTTLTLTKLRRSWTAQDRNKFFEEVQAFQTPAFILKQLPNAVSSTSVIFERPIIRDSVAQSSDRADIGFDAKLEGDLVAGEEYWETVAEMAHWVIEIRSTQGKSDTLFGIAPTIRTLRKNPEAKSFKTKIPHPNSNDGPFFDARIFVREGAIQGQRVRDLRTWVSKASGIRVYLEGFRILPYGEDDWLSIDADYASRPRQLEMLRELSLAEELEVVDPNEGLVSLPHNNYFGGVFLTQERAPTLRVLVNREGFVPNSSFSSLVKLVRTGIDLCTRVRAATNLPARQKRHDERKKTRGKDSAPDVGKTSLDFESREDRKSLPELLDTAGKSIRKARSLVSQGNISVARSQLKDAVHIMGEAKERAESVISEGALFRVLASVGTQMAAFAHEMNALLGSAQTLRQGLRLILDNPTLKQDHRRQVRLAWAAAVDLTQWIERHASYLIDVVAPDARRRRTRQLLHERFDAAVKLVKHTAERRNIRIENRISSNLRVPPMFPAEITTVFANLLTNALKGVGRDGDILATGNSDNHSVRFCLQNTGSAINLQEAERWFEPFESTTIEVNSVLGQGMGLGLTITRRILDYYGANIKFIDPESGFATAIEITFPQ